MICFVSVDPMICFVSVECPLSVSAFHRSIIRHTCATVCYDVAHIASIFENLWKQNELYEQLKIHDKMQREFINIAAHELKTPIQPIHSLTELLRSPTTFPDKSEVSTSPSPKRLRASTRPATHVRTTNRKSLVLLETAVATGSRHTMVNIC